MIKINIQKQINHMIEFLYDLFLPAFCIGCYQYTIKKDEILCQQCAYTIQPLVSKTVYITQKKSVIAHCIGRYNGVLQRLICAKNKKSIAMSKKLGFLAANWLSTKNLMIDAIVPIPLHWSRFASRGYNQAHEIALEISNKLKKPLLTMLKRHSATKPQTECSFQERKTNLIGKIKINDTYQLKKASHILLVDDVMTTSATVKEAAKQLVKEGYQVTIFVIARTI